MMRISSIPATISLLVILGIGSSAWAYRDYFSEAQKA